MKITRRTTGKRYVTSILVPDHEWLPNVGWSLVNPSDPSAVFQVNLGRDKDGRAVDLGMTLAEAESLAERLAIKIASAKSRIVEYNANPGHVVTTSTPDDR